MSVSNKTYRIAAASTDGKTVNEHFGRAAEFLIYDIGASDWTFVEKRSVTPLCEACAEHTSEQLSPVIAALADCAAVVTVKIGAVVRRELAINNISVFEQPDDIDNVLSKLAAYYGKTNKEKQK